MTRKPVSTPVKWPHYSVTIDMINAAAKSYFVDHQCSPYWHPEDVASWVITAAEAIGAALGEGIRTGKIHFEESQ